MKNKYKEIEFEVESVTSSNLENLRKNKKRKQNRNKVSNPTELNSKQSSSNYCLFPPRVEMLCFDLFFKTRFLIIVEFLFEILERKFWMANILKQTMGKHRKWVAMLSYSGTGYYGMQRQVA